MSTMADVNNSHGRDNGPDVGDNCRMWTTKTASCSGVVSCHPSHLSCCCCQHSGEGIIPHRHRHPITSKKKATRRSLHLSSHYILVLEYSTTTKLVFFLAAQIAMEDISRCFPIKSWPPSMPAVNNYDPIVCQISKAPCKAKSIKQVAPFIKVNRLIKCLPLLLRSNCTPPFIKVNGLIKRLPLLLLPRLCCHIESKLTSQKPCHHHLFMLVSPMLCQVGLTKIKMTASMLLSPCHQERSS